MKPTSTSNFRFLTLYAGGGRYVIVWDKVVFLHLSYCSQGGLLMGDLQQEEGSPPPPTQYWKSGCYASYWNAFLFLVCLFFLCGGGGGGKA